MDFNNLFQTTVFPIAACIALGFFIFQVYKDFRETTSKREDKYIEIINNTNMMLNKCNETNAKFVEQLETMQASMKTIEDDVDDIKDYLDLNKRASDKKE